jgi:hypothetical protein
VVARAYLDQLERSGAQTGAQLAELRAALDRAAAPLRDGERDRKLAARLEALAPSLPSGTGDTLAARRIAALADTLDGIAARLRQGS